MANKPLEQTLQLNDGFSSPLDKINKGLENTIKNFSTFANLGNQTVNFTPHLDAGFEEGIRKASDDLAKMRADSVTTNLSDELSGLDKLSKGIQNTYSNYESEIEKVNSLIVKQNTQMDFQISKVALLNKKLSEQQVKMDEAGSAGKSTVDLELSMLRTEEAIEKSTQSLVKQQQVVDEAQIKYRELTAEARMYESLMTEVAHTQRTIADSPVVKMDELRQGVVGIQTLIDKYENFKAVRMNDHLFAKMQNEINGNVGLISKLKLGWDAVSMHTSNAVAKANIYRVGVLGSLTALKRNTSEWARQNPVVSRLVSTSSKLVGFLKNSASALAQGAKNAMTMSNNLEKSSNSASKLSSGLMRSQSSAKALNFIAGLLTFQTAINGLERMKSLADKIMGVVDEVTMLTARLSYLEGDVADNMHKIMQSANASRSAFSDTAQFVARMATNAGDAFSSTDQIIAFTEILNKMYKLGGATAKEQAGSMLQLSQAMGQGILQGQELNSVMQGAPMVAEAIAKYLGVSKGELKALGHDGKLTADIVRNAMFTMASEVNGKFAELPKTWESEWQRVKNAGYSAFNGLIQKLNQFVNSEQGKAFFDGLVTSMYALADIGGKAIDAMQKGFEQLKKHAKAVQDIFVLIGIVSVVMLVAWLAMNWVLVLIIGSIIALGAGLGEMGVSGLDMVKFLAGGFMYLLAVLYNIGLFLIKLAISIGIITVEAGLIIFAFCKDVWSFISTLFTNIWYGLLNFVDHISDATGKGIAFFKYLWDTIVAGAFVALNAIEVGFKNFFIWLINGLLDKVAPFIDMVNAMLSIMGKNPINIKTHLDYETNGSFDDKVDEWNNKANKAWQDTQGEFTPSHKYKSFDGLKNTNKEFDELGSALQLVWGTGGYKDPSEEYKKGADAVQGLADDISNWWKDKDKERENSGDDDDPFGNDDVINALAGDTSLDGGYLDEVDKINEDVSITDEDLKYLRDIAERKYTLKYNQLTPNATVNYYGAGGTDQDVENLLSRMETMVQDKADSYLG